MGDVVRGLFSPQCRLEEAVEHLLDRVRQGEVVGIAIVYRSADRGLGTGWAGELPPFETLGGIEILKVDFVQGKFEHG